MFYYLNKDEIEVCRSRQWNYLDIEAGASGKIIYYMYADTDTWRMMYNLNYYKEPRGAIIPSYQPVLAP